VQVSRSMRRHVKAKPPFPESEAVRAAKRPVGVRPVLAVVGVDTTRRAVVPGGQCCASISLLFRVQPETCYVMERAEARLRLTASVRIVGSFWLLSAVRASTVSRAV
jgi:hypothetical protein